MPFEEPLSIEHHAENARNGYQNKKTAYPLYFANNHLVLPSWFGGGWIS